MVAISRVYLLTLQAMLLVSAKSTTSEVTTNFSTSSSSTSTGSDNIVIVTSASEVVPTGSYLSYTTTITLAKNESISTTSTATTWSNFTNANDTGTATSLTTTTDTAVQLSGTRVVTSSSTVTATTGTNTQACNGYMEFCERKYSNITMVTAHNSPFVKKNNLAANQAYTVRTQLNDGVRMVSFEAHYYEEEIYLCHTSCDLLNMGTLQSYLTTITDWVKENPYDVVTVMIVNSDYVDPANFSGPIQNSGLIDYVYEPWKIPMNVSDWPTLSEMILSEQRVVVFMDYQADQSSIPYILDEFSQMWETPFSPLNASFPCTVQRPPGITAAEAEECMYMANHNLNIEVLLEGIKILIPDTAQLNTTNAISGYGSLGLMANNCRSKWDRPPNFLLVDYYNDGNFPGSVFEVAAQMNNVTYNGKCCGAKTNFFNKTYTV
ncbi:PLC-like phosphodiesterase [Aspergillus homomorphus CBS 101889]|uniref:PLC-like phosphodiesterase n=1 Tax=Aspergillus homomorphus (strain CBS 101889) TaxID=1450537 RepID=A0A395HZR4_ASPHC|nr:PLC-like phosphodiesterase [Aspergillus homomorphus CBS 101889]RAL13046.1 PLC-like phosphodiesterase [Aspergillus homomorphus CBS 101889]